jgi:hypothetical protein
MEGLHLGEMSVEEFDLLDERNRMDDLEVLLDEIEQGNRSINLHLAHHF